MADPNAHQSSRVKQQRQKKKKKLERRRAEISFMKQMNATIYKRMVLRTNLLIKCNYLCTFNTEIQFVHNSNQQCTQIHYKLFYVFACL